MALPDLTGQNIQDTYQRVLQVSGSGLIADGTGSLFTPLNATSASYADYAVSASHEIILEVSSSYAETASFALTTVSLFPFTGDAQITGSLTVSGSVEFPGRRGITSNVVIGSGSGASLGSGATDNIILGKHAGSALSIGDRNVLIGTDAGKALTQAGENVIIGRRAGQVLHSTNAHFNVVIGADAGQGAGGSGHARNVIIGHTAGYETDGEQNVYIGSQAAKGVGGADADYGVAVGSYALYSIRDGHKNATLGAGSLFTVRDGSDNIGLGYYAGYSIQDGSGNIIIGSGSLGEAAMSNQLRIGHADTTVISGSLATGDIIFPSTASAAYFSGDGSQLTNLPASSTFPFTGDAQITGSLTVSGSVVDFMSASAINLDIEKIPLVNPMVEYFDVGLITGSGTTITLPNSLTYVSSSVYEYLEVFVNGLRLRYNRDFIPMSNTSIKYNITIVSGSEVTYKSLKRP